MYLTVLSFALTACDSENDEPDTSPLRLVETGSVIIGNGIQPDLVASADRLYLVYNAMMQGFKLVVLDLGDLRAVAEIDLWTPLPEDVLEMQNGIPTDIRLAVDGYQLWYAFELIDELPVDNFPTYLFAARYNIQDATPVLAETNSQPLVISTGGQAGEHTRGNEITNDPTPIFLNGQFHVMTRFWG